jgi:hypothetical protein
MDMALASFGITWPNLLRNLMSRIDGWLELNHCKIAEAEFSKLEGASGTGPFPFGLCGVRGVLRN